MLDRGTTDSRSFPPLPSAYYTAGTAEGDLRAIIVYVRSLPPVKNQVPPPERRAE